MHCEIVQSFRFEAAHYLPRVGPMHRCRRMHGHSYKVDVHVDGPIDPDMGWVIDFFEIERAFAPILAALDHQVLNEVDGLENPTAEHIAAWIYDRVKPTVPELAQVVVHETEHCRAIYRG